jgi:hypothetical protein
VNGCDALRTRLRCSSHLVRRTTAESTLRGSKRALHNARAMDLQALANIAQILSAAAVIAAIVFGLIQIRQFRLQRRDAAAAELVRSFHDPLFAQSLRLIAALPSDAKAEQLRAGGAGMEDAALYIGVQFETIGLLVFRGVMPLSLVDHLVSPRAVSLWSRLRDWSRLVREEEAREHFLEWFQWLAEQLDKIGRHAHPPAFVKYRAWSPPRE